MRVSRGRVAGPGGGLGGRGGFTLTEIAVVLTMVGVLVAVAISRASGVRRTVGLESSAQELLSDLRRAQLEAIRRNRVVGLTRIDSVSYRIDYVGKRMLTSGVVFDATASNRVEFAPFGPLESAAGAFTLRVDGRRKVVRAEQSGLLRVMPTEVITGGTTVLGGGR